MELGVTEVLVLLPVRRPLKPSCAVIEFSRIFILWNYYSFVKASRMSHIAFVHILSQLVFEVWHLEFLRDYLQEKGFSSSPRNIWLCTLLGCSLDGEATVHVSGATAISQMYLLYFPQMDDNLRQSPQLPPRKLPTLKLTPAEEESNSLQRLSPWQSLCFVSKVRWLVQ